MSRNDRRRGSRGKSWNNRDNNERTNERARGKDGRQSDRSDKAQRTADRHTEQRRHFTNPISHKEIEENQNAIRAFKEQVVTCDLCGEAITDLANAIANKGNANPVHFDCVLNKLTETERPSTNEKIAYIGQGKFALLYFENPHDQKHFSIRKTIEWESRESERGSWRNEMAGLFSQVK